MVVVPRAAEIERKVARAAGLARDPVGRRGEVHQRAGMPADGVRAGIIHNDFKFDNVVLNASRGSLRITGVLDWEMATLGDPLMDLGCSLAYWVEAEDPPALMAARMMPTHLPGMMNRREIVDYYGLRSGATGICFDFYYTFGLAEFKAFNIFYDWKMSTCQVSLISFLDSVIQFSGKQSI